MSDIGTDNVSAQELMQYIERIETLTEQKQAFMDDIKDVYGEAKSVGFDTKTMKKLVSLRKLEKAARDEADALLETYRSAIGLL